MTNTAKCSGWRAFAAISLVLTFSLPSLASWTAVWQGGTSGNWNVAANWTTNTLPDTTGYAQFKKPYADPLTVTLDDLVRIYSFSFYASRTAGVTVTGSGAVEITR